MRPLAHKKLFAPEGSDGMTIDQQGNVYLTTRAVRIYNPAGTLIETIDVPEGPAVAPDGRACGSQNHHISGRHRRR